MKYQTVAQARRVASVISPDTFSTCSERLTLWARRMEALGERRLNLLQGVEFGPKARRDALREENSPLTVAYGDPSLHELGLTGDSYGEVLRFFGVGGRTFHEIVCYCHYPRSLASASEVAARIRQVADRARRVERAASSLGLGRQARSGGLLMRLFI